MKFLSTCSQMSFQKYTWIKGRQLPKRAFAVEQHILEDKNPNFCAAPLAGSSSPTCVHCHQLQSRCFHLSGTTAAFESAPDKGSQRMQGVLEPRDPFQQISAESALLQWLFPQKLLHFYGSTTRGSQDILILSSLSQGLTGPSKDKALSIIFIEFL